jgi:hypothetical protein
MYGAAIFGTTPYGGLLTSRQIKPSTEDTHKEVYVPIVNLGGEGFGASGGKLVYVPTINTGPERMTEE